MKKLLFIFALLPLVAFGQNYRIQIDTTYYLQGTNIIYDSTEINIVDSLDYIKISKMPTNCDSFHTELKKKKKKKSSDSAIHVYLYENYPPQGMGLNTAKNWNYKRTLLGCGVAFLGGVANGYHETILNHYPQFKKVHPNANDQYWNPQISWLNKYEDFDKYGKREAYFGSTTFLAWTTDAYHLSSVISNTSLIGATCIITIGEKRKWWEYGIDIVAMSLSRSAGFHLIYSKIYK